MRKPYVFLWAQSCWDDQASRVGAIWKIATKAFTTALSMESVGLFTLDPCSGIRLSYLAEGAANIVYQIVHPPTSPSTEADLGFPVDQADGALPATPPPTEISPTTIDPLLQGKLIRLRKDLSTTVPVTESWDHFQNVVTPLFLGSQLVSQTLFKISREFVRNLNAELRCMENDGRRGQMRHGVYVDENEAYGTLVSNMSSDESSMSIEFKPKWLVQSPSAPQGSKRCRTCALRAMKQARIQGTRRGDDGKDGFCPLSLASRDRSKVQGVVEHFLGSSQYSDIDRMFLGDQLLKWFPESPLLQRLKQLQRDLDPQGVLKADLQSQNFLTAMTIRDCTLFLKVGVPSRSICMLIIYHYRYHDLILELSRLDLAIWISSRAEVKRQSIGKGPRDD